MTDGKVTDNGGDVYTEGPWFVADDDDNGQAIVRGKHIEVATCWHHCVGSIEREMRHNARLIAAAPELLEALVDLVSEVIAFGFGRDNEHIEAADKKARAAIAKATGQ